MRVRPPPDLPPRRRTRPQATCAFGTPLPAPGSSSGRTLVSESRKTGSNPVPGTADVSRRPSLSDNLAPKSSSRPCALTASSSRLERDRIRRDGSSTHGRDEHTFQRSRMVRQPAVNRSFEGSIPSAGARSSARTGHTRTTCWFESNVVHLAERQRAASQTEKALVSHTSTSQGFFTRTSLLSTFPPARAGVRALLSRAPRAPRAPLSVGPSRFHFARTPYRDDVRPFARAARLAEHPPRTREDPVRFRTWAPSPGREGPTRNERRRFDSDRWNLELARPHAQLLLPA